MASFASTDEFSEYTPGRITSVDGFEIGSRVTKTGDKGRKVYTITKFDLAWTSRSYAIIVILIKDGSTRSRREFATDLVADWTSA